MFSIHRRWIISMLGTYSCALMFAQRTGMSVAIVEMTDPKSLSEAPHFDWSETLKGVILGSAFYIYWIVPTIVGSFMERFSAKWMAWMGVFWPCILIALEPWACSIGVGLLITLQIFIGVAHGFTYPSLFHLYVQWFPPEQRSKANASIQVGVSLGSTIMYLIGGHLCKTRIGWPLIFYVCSALHVPWLVLWAWLASDKPPPLANVEVEVENDDKQRQRRQNNCSMNKVKDSNVKSAGKRPTPWLAIFKSTTVWSSILSKFASSYGFFMLMSKLPAFLHQMFDMTIVQNSMINSVAFIGYGITCFLSPYLANHMIQKRLLPLLATRRLFQTLAMAIPCICLILVTVYNQQQTVVVCLLILAMIGYGFMTAGEWTMVSEFAPNFVGIISGLTLSMGFLTAFLAPYVVGLIIDSNLGGLDFKWNLSFYISAALYAICLVIFWIFGTDQRQAWDQVDD